MSMNGITMFPEMNNKRLKRTTLIILDFENGFLPTYLTLCPGLDENGGSSEFVHNIWICYKLQCTKFCTLHFQHLLPFVHCTSGIYCRVQKYTAVYNISRCCVQSRYCRESHPDQGCTKRVQSGKSHWLHQLNQFWLFIFTPFRLCTKRNIL